MHYSILARLTLAFIGVAVVPFLLVGVVLAWQNFTSQIAAEQAVSEVPALVINSMYIIIAIIVGTLLVAGGLGFLMARQIVQRRHDQLPAWKGIVRPDTLLQSMTVEKRCWLQPF